MEERDLEKCCLLQFQTQYTQQIMINGIPQNTGEVQVPVLVCPNCGHIVVQFNPGTTIVQALEAGKNEISAQIHYCVKCGQKLGFPELVTVDSETM